MTTTQLICPQMTEFIGFCRNSSLGTFPCMFSSYLMKDRPTYDLKRDAKNEKTDLYPAGSTPAPYSACLLPRAPQSPRQQSITATPKLALIVSDLGLQFGDGFLFRHST